MSWRKNSFVTLTYEVVPENGSLEKKHVQSFIKDLRYRFLPEKIRYYCCGEYGETSERPHYHLALFNVGIEDRKIIDYVWDKGFVMVGELNKTTARYITDYVTKGYDRSNKWSEEWLRGRAPEFSTMSRRPGIGFLTMDKMIQKMKRGGVEKCDYVVIGGKRHYLGRYLRNKVDEGLGYVDRNLDFYDYQIELYSAFLKEGRSFKADLVDAYAYKRNSSEKKFNIYRGKRGKL